MKNQMGVALAAMLTLGLLAGCGSNPKDGPDGQGGAGEQGMGLGRSGAGELGLGGANGSGSGGRDGADVNSEAENRIYFGYDSAEVNEEARQVLSQNIRRIQSRSGKVVVEGHCDERGTREYNLALGQKRADSVKSYLVSQGVSAANIQTISFGKERPLVNGHEEFAYSKNRRAEIILR